MNSFQKQIKNNLIIIKFLINPENAYNSIERGSLADSSEAQDFRDFLGNKSELRFNDGSICEKFRRIAVKCDERSGNRFCFLRN
jgi:hypothetical protein